MKNSQETKQESLTNEIIISDNSSIASGNIFILGDHILLCGDCTESELVKKTLKGRKIELILTDVPYGIDYVASKVGFNDSTLHHEDIAND